MTKIRNPVTLPLSRRREEPDVEVIWDWSLEFIWDLEFGIWNFETHTRYGRRGDDIFEM
jgi:hypothetical protein